MKKLLFVTVLTLVSIFSASIIAQEAMNQSFDEAVDEDVTATTVRIIDLEDTFGDQHPTAKNVKLTMEYVPFTGEVRLHYVCMAGVFDQGEAMNTSMAFFEQFAVENKYKHYAHREKDKTRYFKDSRGIRMTEYIVYVMFTK